MPTYMIKTKIKSTNLDKLSIIDSKLLYNNEIEFNVLLDAKYRVSYKCHISNSRIIILSSEYDDLTMPKVDTNLQKIKSQLNSMFLKYIEVITSHDLKN